MEQKETKTFDEYIEQNPRHNFPNKEMKDFVKFAIKEYEKHGHVNGTHCEDDEEDLVQEVGFYIGDSMEALLLYKKFQSKKKKLKK